MPPSATAPAMFSASDSDGKESAAAVASASPVSAVALISAPLMLPSIPAPNPRAIAALIDVAKSIAFAVVSCVVASALIVTVASSPPSISPTSPATPTAAAIEMAVASSSPSIGNTSTTIVALASSAVATAVIEVSPVIKSAPPATPTAKASVAASASSSSSSSSPRPTVDSAVTLPPVAVEDTSAPLIPSVRLPATPTDAAKTTASTAPEPTESSVAVVEITSLDSATTVTFCVSSPVI